MTEPDQDALADAIYGTVRSTCDNPPEAMMVLALSMAKIYLMAKKPDHDLEAFLKDHIDSLREIIQAAKFETIQ